MIHGGDGHGGYRCGKVAEWQRSKTTATLVTENILAILGRAFQIDPCRCRLRDLTTDCTQHACGVQLPRALTLSASRLAPLWFTRASREQGPSKWIRSPSPTKWRRLRWAYEAELDRRFVDQL
jgi:hypothetical protein